MITTILVYIFSRLAAYLMVLVRRDCNEGRFREHVSAESGVFGSKSVIFVCLYDVDPRLIFMHGIQDNLKIENSANMTDPVKQTPCIHVYIIQLIFFDYIQ